ncbi:MAG: DUF362 domain-containing protein, partial [Halanaerobiales bacterium]
MMPDKPITAVRKCKTYNIQKLREAAEAMLSDLGGMENFVRPGDRVLLKVNMLSGVSPDRAVTTNPNLVQVVCEMVQEAGGKPFI